MSSNPNHYVVLGQVVGVFGIKGWVKIRSDTDPRDNILEYQPWYLRQGDAWVSQRVVANQQQSKGLIVQFEGVADRDVAAQLVGCEIAVPREQLPAPSAGEYYWADLIGLRVRNKAGEDLGTVTNLLETGANDVLVVRDGELEHLIPFVTGYYVVKVVPAEGYIEVDWQRDFTTGE
ncbi:MAG: ribosome maturation factor RimM [Gammaproteobacteria bacterium]|nr:ribosome maturation factor RimM [Gammaproteobacteria bacterium]